MTSPPSYLVALYRLVAGLAPASHRHTYRDEQVALFERLWCEERPGGPVAQVRWASSLLWRALAAAIGVRLDQHAARLGRAGGGGHVGSDVRFSLRSVSRSPWYAATVVGVVAIVIALATTTLAIVDGVLFRPLPFPDADRLVVIQPGFTNAVPPPAGLFRSVERFGASAVDVRAWRAAVPDVAMAGFRAARWVGLGTGVNDSTAGMAEVDPNFLAVLQVSPLVGGFSEDDFSQPRDFRPALVTHHTWMTRFGGRPDIVGVEVETYRDRERRLGVRVVGVLPESFVFPSVRADVSFVVPLVPPPGTAPTSRNISQVVARLPHGMTEGALRERLMPAVAAVAAEAPPQGPKPEGWSDAAWRRQGPYDDLVVSPLRSSLREYAGPLFGASALAVALLVLVAALNVSSLMAARALERQRELSVRRSLGAGWWALARLWTIEAALLLGAAGGIGMALAPLALGVVVPLLPEEIVLLKTPGIDWRVAGLTLALITLLVAAVSVAPVRRSLRSRATDSRGETERVRSWGRALVVSGQVAAAFALTVLGSSLVGSVLAVYAQEQPVAMDDVSAVQVMIQGAANGAERASRLEAIAGRLASLPGVTAVSASGAQVLVGGGGLPEFNAPAGTRHPRNIDAWPVTAGFYDTLSPRVVSGRVPTNAELRSAAPVMVVSRSAAAAYWPSESALGKTLVHYWSKTPFTVVGVVEDVQWQSWDMSSPIVYAPFAVLSRYPWATLFIRSDRPSGPLLADALRVIEETDDLVQLRRAGSLASFFRDTIALRRFQSWLFGGFAVAALVVVSVGLLGLLAMSAARRTREVGIRCALGATPATVVGHMVREQMLAVVGGLVGGAAVAAWALRGIEGWLYQLTPADPRIWFSALLCLLVMAAVGILLPAIRASRTDPLAALRTE